MKSSALLYVSLLVTPIFASPFLQKRGTVKFNQCSDDQTKTIMDHLEDVERLSAAATTQSEGGRGKFHSWFGDGAGQGTADETINIRYHKFSQIRTSVPKKDVTFDCGGKAFCCSQGTGSVPACGDQPGDDFINICPGYWNWYRKERVHELSPPKGPTNVAVNRDYRTRGYVLLHELMHSQYGSRDVVDTVKDPFGKTYTCRGYGQICALKYAQKNPANARRNADTYALFALASYYGIDNFQTNPDLVQD